MKVFISYSTDDLSLVKQIADQIKPLAEVFYWANTQIPGEHAWNQIYGWIDQADAVIAVVTDKTVSRGISVGQEVGRAIAKQRTVIPLVGADVPVTELGCLHELTHVRLNQNDPNAAFQAISQHIANRAAAIQSQNFWAIVLGVILVVWMMSKSKQ